jgi:hypothetical protein
MNFCSKDARHTGKRWLWATWIKQTKTHQTLRRMTMGSLPLSMVVQATTFVNFDRDCWGNDYRPDNKQSWGTAKQGERIRAVGAGTITIIVEASNKKKFACSSTPTMFHKSR